MTKKEEIRVALVGCGIISDNHLRSLADLPVRVVALCDVIEERAQAKKEAYAKDAAVYTDYVTMLEREKPTAVHICTPHYLHAAMSIEALKRDVYVFLEKPLAMREEEIGQILDAERQSRASVCVCFQNRFNPATQYVKTFLEKEGQAQSGYGLVFWKRDAAYYASEDWRGKRATEGGGSLINQAIHTLDLLTVFFGKPQAVTATVSNHSLKGVIDVEDSAEGCIRFDGGKIANFATTNATGGFGQTVIFLKSDTHEIRIDGEALYIDGERVRDVTAPAPLGKKVYGAGHPTLIAKFYDAIREGKEMPVSAESASYALRIVLAAYRSLDTEIKL